VHATARDPNSKRAVGHLTSLPGAAERLKLFQADLLREGAFDEAMAGCAAVLHTASPYALDCPPGKEEEMLIGPALKGTKNVLDSVNRTPSVTRVLVTSSVVGVWGDPNERGKGHVFTEEDWNKIAHPKNYPYFYSKMKAEQLAYEMAEAAKGRWSLVTLNPGVVWGPPLGALRGAQGGEGGGEAARARRRPVGGCAAWGGRLPRRARTRRPPSIAAPRHPALTQTLPPRSPPPTHPQATARTASRSGR
jgi:nucleoside-diphosphate-sugar epimerase